MTHLIVNLKSYFMFEVIEGGWQRLQTAMEDATTLDEAISAHDRYLDGIVCKSMVRDEQHNDSMQQLLADHVEVVLAITDQFCTLQEVLFKQSLKAADVAAEKRVEAENRMSQGQWGFDNEQDIEEQESFFGLADPSILEEIDRMSEAYNLHVVELLQALSDKVNGTPGHFAENDANLNNGQPSNKPLPYDLRDDDLDPQRFLIAQLDHNNYYANQGPRQ
mmetsp:Transcript_1459/g.2275  ORF Transcript_1459/g.2275 Transcript_1459/m.2275 type:complete len:220 (-) Transcript_1459:4-663(-)